MRYKSSTGHFVFFICVILVTSSVVRVGYAEGVAFQAMQRLSEGDARFREGRTGKAHAVYLGLLQEFPTWWLPTVKAAVTSRALGLPLATVRAYLDRAAAMSPSGPYLDFVRFLLDTEDLDKRVEPPAFHFGRAVWVDRADRLGLHRALELERQGRLLAAEQEYRAILVRSPLCTTARFRLARMISASGRREEGDRILEEGADASLFPPRWRAVVGQDAGRDKGSANGLPRPKP